MSKIRVEVVMELSTFGAKDGRLLPGVKVNEVTVEIDKKHCAIHIHSKSVWTKIGSWFEGFFKATIIDSIEPLLQDQLKEDIPWTLNYKMTKHDGYLTPMKRQADFFNITGDFSVYEAPKVTQNDVNFGFNGLTFENEFPIVANNETMPIIMP